MRSDNPNQIEARDSRPVTPLSRRRPTLHRSFSIMVAVVAPSSRPRHANGMAAAFSPTGTYILSAIDCSPQCCTSASPPSPSPTLRPPPARHEAYAPLAQRRAANSADTRMRRRRCASAVLWLRRDEMRTWDNPALAAAAAFVGSLVVVVAIEGAGEWRSGARDLRRSVAALGGVCVVRLGGVGAVREVVGEVCAGVVFCNRHGGEVGTRVVCVPGWGGLVERPFRLPPGPPGLRSVEWDVGFGGESAARARLEREVARGGCGMALVMSFGVEVRAGFLALRRVARAGKGRLGWAGGWRNALRCAPAPALLAGSVAAYDVNGGDRRGIEWDAEKKAFKLKEWEHAETERLMNAKERGIEFVRRRKMFFYRAFIPDDVTPDYYAFSAWRFAQRCMSATVGVFGTQALLLALGVKSGRIGQAAAFSWVLKDGLGRVGKMVWASGMGKDFDVDPKRWRFRSALLYAIGNGMEIGTQIFPASFLVVATIANSMKQVSMLTSSATRNAMYRSFGGRAQNIANITAKGEAQIVVADLIGMSCGIYLSKRIGTSRTNVLTAYSILTALDTFGIYMELRQVVFRTLNAERSSLVIEQYVKNGQIISPSDVSRMERIFLKPRYKSRSRFSSIAKAASDPQELEMLLKVFRKERFIVSLPTRGRLPRSPPGPCRVVLRNDARHEDVLRALLTVGFLRDCPKIAKGGLWRNGNGSAEVTLRAACKSANRSTASLMSELVKRGWSVDNLLFGTVKRGASWGTARPVGT